MITKFLKTKWSLLVLIVLIAGFLRLYQIGTNPPSLTWDEVAWGYNAYTLSLDGKDEFGRFLPYDYLESFGDFKPPLYAYLSVIPVVIFGLNEFSVRFASAFFGTLTVLVTFFVTRELFYNRKAENEKNKNFETIVALAAAAILAISPWHIMLSRAAFEANVATFFIVTGVWLFFLGIRKMPLLLVVSLVSFIASVYTFNSTRIVAPLLLLLLVVGNYKELLKVKKYVVAMVIVGLALTLPVLPFLTSSQAKLRYAEVNIFSDIAIIEKANQEIANDNNSALSKVIHNRRVAYGREVARHYLDHFNPAFLFIRGDINPKFSTHDVGQLYLWQLPFLASGVILLFRQRKGKWWIIPIWLLIGILPAAVARETPHALRIESTIPTWHILTAYGVVAFVFALKKFRLIASLVLSSVVIFSLTYFLHGYYVHYPKEYAVQWQSGYKDIMLYVNQNINNYEKIYMSNALERGYMYMLFYSKYDPEKFRHDSIITRDMFGFVHVKQVGKYIFIEEDAMPPQKKEKALYIVPIGKTPSGAKVLQEFYSQDGVKRFEAYTY